MSSGEKPEDHGKGILKEKLCDHHNHSNQCLQKL